MAGGLFGITKEKAQKDIKKDIEKMEGLLNKELRIQDEESNIVLSAKSIAETILKVREGASNVYTLCMSIQKGESDIKDLLSKKDKNIFNPGFEDIVKILNQVNELAKILPEEFRLDTGETVSRKGFIDEHKKLINTLKNYSEFNAVKNVKYDKAIAQVIGDNILRYYKQAEKKALDERSIDTIHRKISFILHEIQKEYNVMYTRTKITAAAFEVLQRENSTNLKVFEECNIILKDLANLKRNITDQIEHVTKQIVAILRVTNLDKEIQNNMQDCKNIIDEELYLVKENSPSDKKGLNIRVA